MSTRPSDVGDDGQRESLRQLAVTELLPLGRVDDDTVGVSRWLVFHNDGTGFAATAQEFALPSVYPGAGFYDLQGEPRLRRLTGGIAAHVRHAATPDDGRDEHEVAALLLAEDLEGRGSAVERAHEVHVHHPLHDRCRCFLDRPVVAEPGVADHDVEPAERPAGVLHQPIVTEILPESAFWPAEAYHQDFWKKDPLRYRSYRLGCGRDRRLAELWGAQASKPLVH